MADESEIVSAKMFELGAQGVEERDEETLVKGAANRVTLVASYENEKAAKSRRKIDRTCEKTHASREIVWSATRGGTRGR